MHAESMDAAVDAASQVRFDEAHRCVVPFRLELLPDGARVHGCSVNLSLDGAGAFAEGSLVVGDDAGRWLTVRAQRVPAGSEVRQASCAPARTRYVGRAVRAWR